MRLCGLGYVFLNLRSESRHINPSLRSGCYSDSDLFPVVMADSIIAQVTMAGGAINFTFNEILYSQVEKGKDTSNLSLISAYHNVIDRYDYSYFLLVNPNAYSNVLLTKSAYMDIRNTNIAVSISYTNGSLYQINGVTSGYDYIWHSTILYLIR